MNTPFKTGHAAIIGAGVMGAGIAALLANAGWSVDLLDRLPDDGGTDQKSRNRLAQEGLDRALKARPPQFALPAYASRVRVGNTEDHLDRLREAGWIIEAVAEDLETKQTLLQAVAAHARADAVVSSNTSGLSLEAMVRDCPPEFRARFLGTHFFNPPRTMRPVELVPTAETDPDLFEAFAGMLDRDLGKKVIRAKDTPGFISTRLGMYALSRTIELAVRHGRTVEEVDYLTGPLIGRPKSGTFRLADVVGLAITARIADNLRAALPDDPAYQSLQVPDVMRRLIADGRTGAKSGAGFYRREKSGEILSLDLQSGEYRARIEPPLVPQEIERLPLKERLRALWELSPSHDGGFLQEVLRDPLGYMAWTAHVVADRIVEVDDALMGGFGWEMGPFQTLDALGAIDWKGEEPDMVRRLREAGEERFYYNREGRHYFFDHQAGEMAPLPRPADVIVLKDLRKAGKTVHDWPEADLIDLGDDVVCFSWRTKMGTANPEFAAALDEARDMAEEQYVGLVLGGSGDHFGVGYDLGLLAEWVEARDWDRIDREMRRYQATLGRLLRARIPVVAAVRGYALGGSCEILLHCHGIQASLESYVGLPEANAGLIPTGGGPTRLLVRAMRDLPAGTILGRPDPYPVLRPAWESLRLAKFSSSADEARALGYLEEDDAISRTSVRLLHDTKARALHLAGGNVQASAGPVRVMGESGYARFQWEVLLLRRGGHITAHDERIALASAKVLTAGGLPHETEVSEQYLLELEREVFLTLAGVPETLARIRHLLATGKPLRN
jgi:3-hydroxyacyl-CoA dehydrogenase